MKYNQLVKAIDSASQQLLGRAAAVVNQALVIRNWVVGAYIVEFEQRGEDRAKYGSELLEVLSRDLAGRGLEGLSTTNLKQSRQLYWAYPQIRQTVSDLFSGSTGLRRIRQTLSDEFALVLANPLAPPAKSANTITPLSPKAVLHFSWSQILELIRLDDPLKRAFYENECLKGNWSVRQLQRQIGSFLFERTGLSRNKAAVIKRARTQEPQETIEDLIRDPYVLEFTGLAELPQYTESDLETALLDHLQKFLLELGAGFLFEARQRRITVGNEHDYIDLVFYHRHLRCHVLLDLKTRPFRHGDAGQIHPVRYRKNHEPVLLRLRFAKPQRQPVLHRLHRRPETTIVRAPSRTCRFYQGTAAARPCLLRSLPESTGCHQAREIPQDSLGKAIHKGTSCSLSNGVNFYLNWWKQNVTRADEQPPVGILLCSDKDHTKVQFATAGMDNRLFVSRYLTLLPSAEQLQRFVETDRARVEAAMEQHARSGATPAAAKSKRKKARPSRRR